MCGARTLSNYLCDDVLCNTVHTSFFPYPLLVSQIRLNVVVCVLVISLELSVLKINLVSAHINHSCKAHSAPVASQEALNHECSLSLLNPLSFINICLMLLGVCDAW